MATIICPHCGQAHNTNSKFCSKTGKPIAPNAPERLNSPGPLYNLSHSVRHDGMTGRLPPNSFLNNRYIVIRKIGQGGMSAVYQVSDTHLHGQNWAIKEMSDMALRDPQEHTLAIQNFQKEAQLLSTLNHPNLPKVRDSFTYLGKHYLVIEYIDGQTLEQKLHERGGKTFSEHEIIPYAIQLCQVLTYLHSQHPPIIFRDLKPSNIMVDRQGQIKLIDFGIVRYFNPQKTKDTMNLGTPGYNSPESTSQQTDARSDIYSLCVTLHQLITGYDPTSTPFSIPPARRIKSDISQEMEKILIVGLDNNAQKRWQTTAELKRQFEKLRNYSPVIQNVNIKRSSSGTQNPYAVSQISKLSPTSRPTTRLIQVAVRLTPRQLTTGLAGIIVVLIGCTWFLTPRLAKINFDWNLIPIMAIFGVLAYSAYPKRWVTLSAHAVLTFTLVGTIYSRTKQGNGWDWLILGCLVSGCLMEAWVYFLPAIKGKGKTDPWKREVAWLIGMAILGSTVFLLIASRAYTGYSPIQWVISGLLGATGWFLGDSFNQYILFKQTGLRRPTH